MTDMIEAAAKAMCASQLYGSAWDGLAEGAQETYRTNARATLLAAINVEDEALVRRLTTAIREEVVRQYRDDDRGNWPGGSHDYEEVQSPWLIARVAVQTLKSIAQGSALGR